MPGSHADLKVWFPFKTQTIRLFKEKKLSSLLLLVTKYIETPRKLYFMKTVRADYLSTAAKILVAKTSIYLVMVLAMSLSWATTLHAQNETVPCYTDGIGIVITEDINRVGFFTVSGLSSNWEALEVSSADTGVLYGYVGNGSATVCIDLTGLPDGVYAVTVILPGCSVTIVITKGT